MKRGDLVFADADEIFNGRKIVSMALFWREEEEIQNEQGISVRLEDGVPLILIEPPYESSISWTNKKLVRVFHHKHGFLTGEALSIRSGQRR